MDTQGTLGLKATLDISEMQRNVQKYVQNINMMQDHTDVASQTVARSFSRMQSAAGAFLSLDMARRLATEMVSIYGTFQQLDISFRTMLRNGEKARALMGELVDFAAITPFNLTDVGQGAKQLLAYGTAANNITTELEMLGNVASGVSVPLGDLIYLYGTLRSQGRAYAVDIRQFAGRGIPIYEELAKVLNVSVGEVNTLVEAGRVGFPEVEKAFQNMTGKGGMFFNLMKEQSKAVKGQISNLMDKIDTKFNEFGQSNDAFITAGISGANYLVDHYEEVGSVLAGLIAMYGVHKTALIASAAYYGVIQKAQAAAVFKAEAEALQVLETEEIKASLSKKNLVAGTREYIEALNVEIKAEMDRKTQLAASARAELDAARNRLALAEQDKARALQNVQIRKEELASVIAGAQAEKTASLSKQMSLEREKQSRAALLTLKQQERKQTAIANIEEMKYQQWLLASAGKDTALIEAKIKAKQREIAVISEKIMVAKAEEIQHSRNIVALRKEIATVGENVSSKAVDKAQTALNTAEERLNAAEINRNTLAREVNSKEIAANTAVENANTLSTQLNTVEEKKNTAAKSLSAKATGLLSTSWSKLTGLMKANKWTLIIGAIAAVGYGIYKLVTYQTEAEKWQRKLNDRFREFNSEVAAEKSEIDQLFGKLDAAKKETKEYQDAKDAIIAKYGDYLRGLGEEIEKLNDVEAAYKAISAAAQQSAIDRAIADAKSEASDTYKENSTKRLEQLEEAIKSKIKDERDATALYTQIVQDIQKNGTLSDVTAGIVESFTNKKKYVSVKQDDGSNVIKWDNPIEDAANALKKEREKFDSALADIDRQFGKGSVDYLSMTSKDIQAVIDGYEAEIKAGRETIQITLDLANAKEALEKVKQQESKIVEPDVTKEIEDATKKIVTLKQEIEDLRNGKRKADEGKTVQKTIEDKLKDLKETEAALAALTGQDKQTVKSDKKKQEEANRLKAETADRLLAIKEAQEKIKQQEIDGELELRQSQIDLLNDGSKKTRLQIQLDFDKRKNEINKYYADILKQMQDQERKQWEANNPKWKEQGMTFIPTVKLSDSQMKEYASKMQLAYSSMIKKQADYYRAELEQYQTYEEKRKQVQDKYKQLREDAELSGNSARIAEINREEKKALKEVDEYFGEREDSFKTWANGIVNFSLQQLVAMLEEAQTQLTLARMKAGHGKELGDSDEVALLRAQIYKYEEEIRKRQEQESTEDSKSTKDKYKEWKELYEVLRDVNSELKDVGDSLGGAAAEVIGFASDITTSTLTMISSVTELLDWSNRATEMTAQGASKTMQAIEKASVILAIISAAIKVVGVITNAFSALKEKEIEHQEYLQGIIDLQDAYNNELIKTQLLHDEVWGKNHIGDVLSDIWALADATENYNNLLNEQQKAWKDPSGNFFTNLWKYGTIMGWAGMDAPGTKKTGNTELVNNLRYVTKKASNGFLGIGGNHTKTQNLQDWVKQNMKNPDGSAAELFDKDGRLNLTIAHELIDNHSDRLAGQTKENLEKLIEAQELIEEAEKALTDYISDTFGTLGDGLTDAIVDAFRNGTDAAQAFKTDIIGVLEEVGAQMVRNLFVQRAVEQYQKDLDKVYKDYAESKDEKKFSQDLGEVTENFFSGAMTAIEHGNKFLEFYQGEMKKRGFDLYKPEEDESSRSAVAKGLEAVTQDSVNETNGRLMAVTIILNDLLVAANRQADGQEGMVIAVKELKNASITVNENVRIIKENMSSVVFYLRNIDTNTSKLNNIHKDIQSVRVGIETMVDKGVKML